jgi:hypothetical protein
MTFAALAGDGKKPLQHPVLLTILIVVMKTVLPIGTVMSHVPAALAWNWYCEQPPVVFVHVGLTPVHAVPLRTGALADGATSTGIASVIVGSVQSHVVVGLELSHAEASPNVASTALPSPRTYRFNGSPACPRTCAGP